MKSGDQCAIIGHDGKVEEITYKLVKVTGNKASVIPIFDGVEFDDKAEPLIVHKSRLRAITEMSEDTTKNISVDASTFINDKITEMSGEHWVKKGNFDHDEVDLVCHIIVNGDHQSFISFNTYNGKFGKKGVSFKEYELKDYDKKITKMKKSGYQQA